MAEADGTKVVQQVSSQTNDLIESHKYEGRNSIERKMPKASLKGVRIEISGTVTPTFTTPPVADGKGVMMALIDELQMEDGAGLLREVKSEDIRNLLKTFIGSDSPAFYQKNSATLTAPSTGFIEFGGLLSGQPVSFFESVQMSFENFLAEANFLDTLMLYNGRKENILKVKLNDLTALNKPSNVSDATWASNITIEFHPIISPDSGPGLRWKKYAKSENFQAATDRRAVDIDEVENLAGLGVLVTKGQDNIPITLEEMKEILLVVKVRDGAKNTEVKVQKSLLSIAMENLDKRKQSKIIPGWGYMAFIQGGLLSSALANTFSDFDVEIKTTNSLNDYGLDGVGYNVRILVDDITDGTTSAT